MCRLEIDLTEERHQHIMEELKYVARNHLMEETFGGYEFCLHVGIPDIFTFLEMKITKSIDLGEVNYRFSEMTPKARGTIPPNPIILYFFAAEKAITSFLTGSRVFK